MLLENPPEIISINGAFFLPLFQYNRFDLKETR